MSNHEIMKHTHKKQINAHRNWMISIIDHNWNACSIRLPKKKKEASNYQKKQNKFGTWFDLYHRPHGNEIIINHNTTFKQAQSF